MRTLTRSILASLLLIMATPAYSSETEQMMQVFRCDFNSELDPDDEEDKVVELAAAWLKAAKKMKGGANMELAIRFPIAVGVGVEGDFTWVISTPTFAEWGDFTDAYDGSPAEQVDDKLFNDLADCGQATIWEAVVMR
jgi:hypothetical protein